MSSNDPRKRTQQSGPAAIPSKKAINPAGQPSISTTPGRTVSFGSNLTESSAAHGSSAADGVARARKSAVSTPTFRVPAIPAHVAKSANQVTSSNNAMARKFVDSLGPSSPSTSIDSSSKSAGPRPAPPALGVIVPRKSLDLRKISRKSLPSTAIALGRANQPQRPRLSATLVSSKKTSPNNIRSTQNNNAVITASPSQPTAKSAISKATTTTTTTSSSSSHEPVKQYKSLAPLWQQLDDEVEQRMLLQKRDRTGNMVGFTQRAAAARREVGVSWGGGDGGHNRARGGAVGRGGGGGGGGGGNELILDVNDPDRTKAHIEPRLRLRVGNRIVVNELSDDEEQEQEHDEEEEDEEEERYRPQAKRTAIKGGVGPVLQLARSSSARKIRSFDASSSSSEEISEDSHSASASEEEEEEEEEEDQLDPDQYEMDRDGDVLMRDANEDVENLPFDEEKMITAPLPLPVKREPDDDDIHGRDSDVEDYRPSDALVSSVESLSLAISRMRATRQLPFLRRNVRRGFLERCRGLYVPIYSESHDDEDKSMRRRMQVKYETAGGWVYRAGVDDWVCPVCDLFQHGPSEDEKGFETREMLDRHLSWDHAEVYYEWVPGESVERALEEDEAYEWLLQLVIPEPEAEALAAADTPMAPGIGTIRGPSEDVNDAVHQSVESAAKSMESSSPTPDAQNNYHEDSGIFPSVSLSPPSIRRPSFARSPSLSARTQPQPVPTPTARKSVAVMSVVPTTPKSMRVSKTATHVGKREQVESSLTFEDDKTKVDKGKSVARTPSASASATIRDSASAPRNSSMTLSASASRDTTSRSHSLTGTTPGAAASSTNAGTPVAGPSRARPAQPRARSPTSHFPTPPPTDAPLGPAAQYPYLPASPSHLGDGGGPAYDPSIAALPGHATGETITHSCRPGGPYLFDLLGTLPLAEYGVLSWEVIDREDEIWASDDVKEEYKVMHALWARWVFVPANRNKFVANYLKGVIAFVDTYWRMIHKAAGWSALRYFLFIFLANQFLTGHEVAQVLVHYEKLTGMENWYD